MNKTQRALIDAELDSDRLVEDPEVDALLVGAVDLHVHPAPSPFPRRLSIQEAAADADGAGFRAIVVKSHHLPMQSDVLALRAAGQLDFNTQVFAGIALNDTIGGLNPSAVELVLKLGGKTVWFPTISSPAHIEHHRQHTGGFPTSGVTLRENQPLSLLDDKGSLQPAVHDILDVIATEGAILNCGHLPASEIAVLVPEASRYGIDRIVVSHPEFIVGATPDHFTEWVRHGVFVEHCLAFFVSPFANDHVVDVLRRFSAAGVKSTLLSSDLGQKGMPLPVTGYRRAVRQLLDAGYATDDLRAMTGGNAAQLLGL